LTSRYDVAIVGGGAVGSSVAYFLLSDPSFHGTVAVIERDPAYRRASSALSASAIRQQFSTRENIRMSQFGIGFLREIDRYLRVDDGAPIDIGLTEGGYLYLASASNEATMRANHEIQRDEGADVALLGPDELVARFPWLNVDGVVLGSLGLSSEGWFDGYGLMRAFRRKALALGADYLAAEAVGLEVADHRVDSVRLADGEEVACGTLVNAAGPWARQLAAMADVPLPVEARRRTVFVFDARWQPPDFPLVIDTSGAWFRPEGEGFITGHAPPESEDLPDLPLEVDRRQFDDFLWPALAERVPKFEAIKVTNAWAGYYEVNTFDHNAILGPHPEIANLLFANGFSGHGLMQSPAVGRAISELIVHKRYVTLDLSVFGYDRIPAGKPVVEKNVIG
jgi:FAD-dependent oxidoreductase domain-containing protein 1